MALSEAGRFATSLRNEKRDKNNRIRRSLQLHKKLTDQRHFPTHARRGLYKNEGNLAPEIRRGQPQGNTNCAKGYSEFVNRVIHWLRMPTFPSGMRSLNDAKRRVQTQKVDVTLHQFGVCVYILITNNRT